MKIATEAGDDNGHIAALILHLQIPLVPARIAALLLPRTAISIAALLLPLIQTKAISIAALLLPPKAISNAALPLPPFPQQRSASLPGASTRQLPGKNDKHLLLRPKAISIAALRFSQKAYDCVFKRACSAR